MNDRGVSRVPVRPAGRRDPAQPPAARASSAAFVLEPLEVRSFLSAAWTDAAPPPSAPASPDVTLVVPAVPLDGFDHGLRPRGVAPAGPMMQALAAAPGAPVDVRPTPLAGEAARHFPGPQAWSGAGPIAVPARWQADRQKGEFRFHAPQGAAADAGTKPLPGAWSSADWSSPEVAVRSDPGSARLRMAPADYSEGAAFYPPVIRMSPAAVALPRVIVLRLAAGDVVRESFGGSQQFLNIVADAPTGAVPDGVPGQYRPTSVRGPNGPAPAPPPFQPMPPAVTPPPAPGPAPATPAAPVAVAVPTHRSSDLPATGRTPAASELVATAGSAGTHPSGRSPATAGGVSASAPARPGRATSAPAVATGERIVHAADAAGRVEVAGALIASAARSQVAAVTTAYQLSVAPAAAAAASLAEVSLAVAPHAVDVAGGLGFSQPWTPAGLFVPGTLLGLSPWQVPGTSASAAADGGEWAWKVTAVASFAVAYAGYCYCQAAAEVRREAERAAAAEAAAEADVESVALVPAARRRFVRSRVVA